MKQASNPRRNAERRARRLLKRGDQGQRPKFAAERRHKPASTEMRFVPGHKLPALTCMIVGRESRRIWRDGEPVFVVKPVRAERLARLVAEFRAPADQTTQATA